MINISNKQLIINLNYFFTVAHTEIDFKFVVISVKFPSAV